MEKERYMLIYNEDEFGYSIIDTKEQFSDDIHSWVLLCYLLNQQDARIKELEDENGYIIFADGYDDNGNEVNKQVYTTYKSKCDELIKENQQLKIENGSLRKKISTQLQNNADNVDFMENQRRENQQLINQYDLLNKKYCEEMDKNIALIEQLKQSQNKKAIEVLEKVKELVRDNSTASGCLFAEQTIDVEFFEELIDNQIKELEGENESKNL